MASSVRLRALDPEARPFLARRVQHHFDTPGLSLGASVVGDALFEPAVPGAERWLHKEFADLGGIFDAAPAPVDSEATVLAKAVFPPVPSAEGATHELRALLGQTTFPVTALSSSGYPRHFEALLRAEEYRSRLEAPHYDLQFAGLHVVSRPRRDVHGLTPAGERAATAPPALDALYPGNWGRTALVRVDIAALAAMAPGQAVVLPPTPRIWPPPPSDPHAAEIEGAGGAGPIRIPVTAGVVAVPIAVPALFPSDSLHVALNVPGAAENAPALNYGSIVRFRPSPDFSGTSGGAVQSPSVEVAGRVVSVRGGSVLVRVPGWVAASWCALCVAAGLPTVHRATAISWPCGHQSLCGAHAASVQARRAGVPPAVWSIVGALPPLPASDSGSPQLEQAILMHALAASALSPTLLAAQAQEIEALLPGLARLQGAQRRQQLQMRLHNRFPAPSGSEGEIATWAANHVKASADPARLELAAGAFPSPLVIPNVLLETWGGGVPPEQARSGPYVWRTSDLPPATAPEQAGLQDLLQASPLFAAIAGAPEPGAVPADGSMRLTLTAAQRDALLSAPELWCAPLTSLAKPTQPLPVLSPPLLSILLQQPSVVALRADPRSSVSYFTQLCTCGVCGQLASSCVDMADARAFGAADVPLPTVTVRKSHSRGDPSRVAVGGMRSVADPRDLSAAAGAGVAFPALQPDGRFLCIDGFEYTATVELSPPLQALKAALASSQRDMIGLLRWGSATSPALAIPARTSGSAGAGPSPAAGAGEVPRFVHLLAARGLLPPSFVQPAATAGVSGTSHRTSSDNSAADARPARGVTGDPLELLERRAARTAAAAAAPVAHTGRWNVRFQFSFGPLEHLLGAVRTVQAAAVSASLRLCDVASPTAPHSREHPSVAPTVAAAGGLPRLEGKAAAGSQTRPGHSVQAPEAGGASGATTLLGDAAAGTVSDAMQRLDQLHLRVQSLLARAGAASRASAAGSATKPIGSFAAAVRAGPESERRAATAAGAAGPAAAEGSAEGPLVAVQRIAAELRAVEQHLRGLRSRFHCLRRLFPQPLDADHDTLAALFSVLPPEGSTDAAGAGAVAGAVAVADAVAVAGAGADPLTGAPQSAEQSAAAARTARRRAAEAADAAVEAMMQPKDEATAGEAARLPGVAPPQPAPAAGKGGSTRSYAAAATAARAVPGASRIGALPSRDRALAPAAAVQLDGSERTQAVDGVNGTPPAGVNGTPPAEDPSSPKQPSVAGSDKCVSAAKAATAAQPKQCGALALAPAPASHCAVSPLPPLVFLDRALNAQQRGAVFSVLHGGHGRAPYMLIGPAGCGKSRCLTEAIMQLLVRTLAREVQAQQTPPDDASWHADDASRPRRLLIVAPSDPAADLVLLGLHRALQLPCPPHLASHPLLQRRAKSGGVAPAAPVAGGGAATSGAAAAVAGAGSPDPIPDAAEEAGGVLLEDADAVQAGATAPAAAAEEVPALATGAGARPTARSPPGLLGLAGRPRLPVPPPAPLTIGQALGLLPFTELLPEAPNRSAGGLGPGAAHDSADVRQHSDPACDGLLRFNLHTRKIESLMAFELRRYSPLHEAEGVFTYPSYADVLRSRVIVATALAVGPLLSLVREGQATAAAAASVHCPERGGARAPGSGADCAAGDSARGRGTAVDGASAWGPLRLSHVVFDEAAQALEPEALLPLLLAGPETRVIMSGDPRQLGPIVRSAAAQCLGLGVSLQERLLLGQQRPPLDNAAGGRGAADTAAGGRDGGSGSHDAPACELPPAFRELEGRLLEAEEQLHRAASRSDGPQRARDAADIPTLPRTAAKPAAAPAPPVGSATQPTLAATARSPLPGVAVPRLSALVAESLKKPHRPLPSGATDARAGAAAAAAPGGASTPLAFAYGGLASAAADGAALQTESSGGTASLYDCALLACDGVALASSDDSSSQEGSAMRAQLRLDLAEVSPEHAASPFIGTLSVNYRSHPLLLVLPSRLFYSGTLVSEADPVLTSSALAWSLLSRSRAARTEGAAGESAARVLSPTAGAAGRAASTPHEQGFPILALGVRGLHDTHEMDSPSYWNEREVAAVVWAVRHLLAEAATSEGAFHSFAAGLAAPPPTSEPEPSAAAADIAAASGFPALWRATHASPSRVQPCPPQPLSLPLDSPSPPAVRIGAGDVAVITPYRQQVLRLRSALRAAGLGAVNVGTVEHLQGGERRVVVISTVLSQRYGERAVTAANLPLVGPGSAGDGASESARISVNGIDPSAAALPQRTAGSIASGGLAALPRGVGLFGDPKPFNVSVTRPQSCLVCVGDPLVWRRDPCWSALLQLAADHDAYLGWDGLPCPVGPSAASLWTRGVPDTTESAPAPLAAAVLTPSASETAAPGSGVAIRGAVSPPAVSPSPAAGTSLLEGIAARLQEALRSREVDSEGQWRLMG